MVCIAIYYFIAILFATLGGKTNVIYYENIPP